MYEVTITIHASPSKYWGTAEYIDKKGKLHCREIIGERIASKQSNTLQGLIEALGVLQTSCMLTIYSDEDYLLAAFQNGWVQQWQQHSWKNAKGKVVRNAEQWQQVCQLLTPHSRRVIKCPKA